MGSFAQVCGRVLAAAERGLRGSALALSVSGMSGHGNCRVRFCGNVPFYEVGSTVSAGLFNRWSISDGLIGFLGRL